jgi:hypothetical protein
MVCDFNLTYTDFYIATIIQGRYDMVCPPQTAHDLHEAWPESRLYWIPDAGHSATVSALLPLR